MHFGHRGRFVGRAHFGSFRHSKGLLLKCWQRIRDLLMLQRRARNLRHKVNFEEFTANGSWTKTSLASLNVQRSAAGLGERYLLLRYWRTTAQWANNAQIAQGRR
jgi:hypothetical protein